MRLSNKFYQTSQYWITVKIFIELRAGAAQWHESDISINIIKNKYHSYWMQRHLLLRVSNRYINFSLCVFNCTRYRFDSVWFPYCRLARIAEQIWPSVWLGMMHSGCIVISSWTEIVNNFKLKKNYNITEDTLNCLCKI